jgi:hypothetical protein
MLVITDFPIYIPVFDPGTFLSRARATEMWPKARKDLPRENLIESASFEGNFLSAVVR